MLFYKIVRFPCFFLIYAVYYIQTKERCMGMFTKNICKFITASSEDQLTTHCFIYETDVNIMAKPLLLPYNRILLIKTGTFQFRLGQTRCTGGPGTLLFAFADEQFIAEGDEGASYLYIDFSGNRSQTLFRRFGISEINRSFSGFDALIPFWQDSLFRASPENIDIAAESTILHSFSKLCSSTNAANALIQKIVDITDDAFGDPELSISAIAKHLSYNAKYLSHLFKEKMGVGYTEYLRTHRIKYALLLLDHDIDSVKNIAALCGFSDPLYFSKIFKQVTGISPSDYKKQKR